jgi:GH15 family glucan-1,4-alpha-glucosidase
MTSPYRPIGDYAIIGCTRSAALVSSEGSIDWLCWPRFHSPSVFGRLLDHDRGGYFAIRPSIPFRSARRYIEATNVLETTFATETGIARLIDLMPVMTEDAKRTRLSPFRQLLRRVDVIEGEVPFEVVFVPRPEYGSASPRIVKRDHSIITTWDAHVLHLRSDAQLDCDDSLARAQFTLVAGEQRTFALGYDERAPAVFCDLDTTVDETIAVWREWSAQLTYKGPYASAVLRSVLVLKLLSYAPTGAIVAAPTTSLPEMIGGVRNWDYRYCWLRDASFTVSALFDCGFEREGAAYVDWLVYATRLTQPHLQILYDVFGEPRVPERVLEHLEGYQQSRPVRAGNDARSQFQLDVYGEVAGAVEEAAERGKHLSRDVQRLLHRLANLICRRWREPDSGIWEKRSGLQQHIHAKVMAWSALDSIERLAKSGKLKGDDRWTRTKDEIRAFVLGQGYNEELNSFVSIAGGRELDASLLYVARVGFLEPDDPRMLGTLDAIRGALGDRDLIYRYDTRSTKDGLPSGEGAFLACSFWLAEALALAGRDGEAHALYEQLLTRANDVGLFSEEMDAASGEMLGNFPQALTHIALINAALCLEKKAPRSAAAQASA